MGCRCPANPRLSPILMHSLEGQPLIHPHHSRMMSATRQHPRSGQGVCVCSPPPPLPREVSRSLIEAGVPSNDATAMSAQSAEGAAELSGRPEAASMLRAASLGDKLGDSVGATNDDPPLSQFLGAHRPHLS